MIDEETLKRIDRIYCDDCKILCPNRNKPVRTCRETIGKLVKEIDPSYKPDNKEPVSFVTYVCLKTNCKPYESPYIWEYIIYLPGWIKELFKK
jgi:hypothetical protein